MKQNEPKSPDTTEKKGLLRLFELIDRDGGKFYKSGLLALLSMIPFMIVLGAAVVNGAPIYLILSIPAGMLAAPQIVACADTVMRSMRDEIGWWWWDTYKTVWKRNLKASLLPGAVIGFLIAAQLFGLYVIALLEDPVRDFWMLFAAALVETAVLGFYLPMLVCMELPFPALLRNCFVLFFFHPIKSLTAALLTLIYFIIILIWFPLTTVLLAGTGIWLPMLFSCSILYPALDRHFGLKEAYKNLQKSQWESEQGDES